jgi:DNA-binding NarL/FixJ family response regulator
MKNILIVDDHSFVLEAYENLLRNIDNNIIENIYKETSVENAIFLINKDIQIDIAFFDISMPKSTLYNIDDGIDLATYFKARHPFAKVVFITMHMEFFILLKAIHLIKPEVFISKTDIEPETFASILNFINKSKIFYSHEMLQVYKWSKINQVKLDNYDFQILSLTKKGVKTKELINYLPLSMSAIEKRKFYHKLILTDFNKVML